jgi:hypothetical protein
MRSNPTRPNQQPGHPIVARSWSSATGQAFAWAGCIENTNKTISQTGAKPLATITSGDRPPTVNTHRQMITNGDLRPNG